MIPPYFWESNVSETEDLMQLTMAQLERLVCEEATKTDAPLVTGLSKDDIRQVIAKIKESIENTVTTKKAQLKTLVCERLSFCEALKKPEIDLVALLLDAGVSAIFLLPLPPSTATVYLLRSGVFQRVCEC